MEWGHIYVHEPSADKREILLQPDITGGLSETKAREGPVPLVKTPGKTGSGGLENVVWKRGCLGWWFVFLKPSNHNEIQ